MVRIYLIVVCMVSVVQLDTQALQTAEHATLERFRSPVRANASATSSGFVTGTPGTGTCPSGLPALSEEECEAYALMDFTGSLQHINLLPFMVDQLGLPEGCVLFSTLVIYNTHATSTPQNAQATPLCKTADYSLYKSACPGALVSVDPTDCSDFASSFAYSYIEPAVSDPSKPPGCSVAGGGFGISAQMQRGKVYWNSHPTGGTTSAPGGMTYFAICEAAASTPAPSAPLPAVAPMSGGSTSATGDPHMTTISGVKFDIMREGTHALLHIPQAAAPADTLLKVQATVSRAGAACEEIYITVLNVTGIWAEELRAGGFSFVTEAPASDQIIADPTGTAEWVRLGMLDLKVVRGRTKSGTFYLNMYARHLRDTSKKFAIGGILGLDDHSDAATPPAACSKRNKILSLLSSRDGGSSRGEASTAEAGL